MRHLLRVRVTKRERRGRGHARTLARGGFESVRTGDVELEREGEGGRHTGERGREEGRDPLDVVYDFLSKRLVNPSVGEVR